MGKEKPSRKNQEIEIKVKIQNVAPLLGFLSKNASLITEQHQVDEYFTPAHRDFLEVRPVKEWFRLRDTGQKCSLNYKSWHFDKDGKGYHCDEYETGVGDRESTRKILDALNFTSLVVVDKTRRSWEYEDYEISLDSVEGLGDFVEIEYIGDGEDLDPKRTTEEMVDFLKNAGCGVVTRNFVGYPFLLLFPEEAQQEVQ